MKVKDVWIFRIHPSLGLNKFCLYVGIRACQVPFTVVSQIVLLSTVPTRVIKWIEKHILKFEVMTLRGKNWALISINVTTEACQTLDSHKNVPEMRQKLLNFYYSGDICVPMITAGDLPGISAPFRLSKKFLLFASLELRIYECKRK